MKERSAEGGYILVTVAILLVALLGFASLGIDTGVLYEARTEMQRVVDSAALAGVSTFVLNPFAPQPGTATQYALETALAQTVLSDPVEAGDLTINVDVANQLVTVALNQTEDTYLARVLGVFTADIGVQATAEASLTASGATCVKPWFVPNTILIPPGSETCDACDPAKPESSQVLIQNGQVTAWAQAQTGQQFVLKPQRPADALGPGQFYALQLGNGTGAAVYRDNIATCVTDPVYCDTCYSVETGNMVGPTRQGVVDMIGSPPDEFIDVGCYGPECSDTSPSLIVAPIWDPCSTPDPGGCPATGFCPDGNLASLGTNVSLRVLGFALIFLEGVQGNDVVARFINVSSCGIGGGTGSPGGGSGSGEVGPYSVPVRLIQTPQ